MPQFWLIWNRGISVILAFKSHKKDETVNLFMNGNHQNLLFLFCFPLHNNASEWLRGCILQWAYGIGMPSVVHGQGNRRGFLAILVNHFIFIRIRHPFVRPSHHPINSSMGGKTHPRATPDSVISAVGSAASINWSNFIFLDLVSLYNFIPFYFDKTLY